MNSKKIEIEVPNGKKAEWVNGVLTLVDEKPVDIRERIKTFKDACDELSASNPLVRMYNFMYDMKVNGKLEGQEDVLAYTKLRIIVAALNEGWKPEFTEDEWRYFPWFYLYTQKEIDEMSEEDKHRVVYRSYSYASAYGGVAYAHAYNDSSHTLAYIGSRLAFKSSELAEYAGKQFIEIWADYVFKPEEKK